MDNKLLGLRIKEARKRRRVTLDELGADIGLHKSTISRYERGEIDTPKLPVIEAIANCLQTNPLWLIGKSDDMTYTPTSTDFSVFTPNNLFSPLKSLRKARGVSVEDVAYKIGISAKDYAAIENGRNTDCITLARIAEYYCCSTDFALSFDGLFNEEAQISFTRDVLMDLHNVFGKLSPDRQMSVINYAKSLLEDNISSTDNQCNILRIAARDGSFSEHHLTCNQLNQLQGVIDQMSEVPEEL